jgi:NADP-dependent 3-hydroxy acid dehydrogenase YdfG
VEAVAARVGGRALPLDVTDTGSVDRFFTGLERLDLLVNNAGLALNQDPIESIADADLTRMWETNVLGVLRATRAALPLLRRSASGHVIILGSTAGFENYPGGVGYTASKHAVRAISQTLRLELLGEPIRVSEVAPGLTRTDFRKVRFPVDGERAEAAYRGMRPLLPEDVAACIAFVATRPPEVNIDYLVVRPRDQASNWHVHRRPDGK